jgi:glycerol-3-phosphate dehydrogenase
MLALTAETRASSLAAMAEGTLDVLVIGGGITGAGVALDAAARGLRVGLVEREDIASGTSGRSSRLIHGGARYLRRAELGLVRESLRERSVLLRLAPHLVRPLPFLLPAHRPTERASAAVGLGLYGVLAPGRSPRHRWVDEGEALRLAPGLARPSGGYVYWDCQTDDARLTLEVVRAAARFGAQVATRSEAEGLTGRGRVTGVRVLDRRSGDRLEVRSRITVNATGAWADRLLPGSSRTRLRPSVGVHVVLDRRRIPIRSAVLVPSAGDRRALFLAIPWGPRLYVGPTDAAYDGPLEEPAVDPAEVRTLVSSVERAFGAGLTENDVVATWAGVRPLLATGRGPTRDLSRRHVVVEDPPGLVTVTGGKLTTYRAMAEEVVNRVCRALGSGEGSRTTRIPLGLSRPLAAERARAAAWARKAGLPPVAGIRLVERYGDDWPEAAEAIADQPSLGEPDVPGLPVLRVEAVMARRRELALTEEDVVVRRTRLATLGAPVASGDAVW